MSAVAHLPTAAAAPVVQPRRRGRFPNGVVPLWRARVRREKVAMHQRLVDEARAALAEWHGLVRYHTDELARLQPGTRRPTGPG